VREELKDFSRAEIMGNHNHRSIIMKDVLEVLDEEILKHSFLFRTIEQYRPDIIIDCVNTATAVAYQDIYSGYYQVKKELKEWDTTGAPGENLRAEVEKFLCTAYTPQLIRHIQILYEATHRFGVASYIKVGTSGTGGMGLNIPYTHSEERPSRVLLSKTSIAGAHTLLLFLMARTPEAPYVKEIKPASTIAWKEIGYGEIPRRGNKPIPLYDCPPKNAIKLGKGFNKEQKVDYLKLGENLKSVYIDTGENGIFSYGEFCAITSYGQMQYVTPEEIAKNVIIEIKGGNTGKDVICALDASVMGATYRAGYMRQLALDKMEELIKKHQCDSVAFENLGPPRLSKLLFEAHLLKLAEKNMTGILKVSPAELSKKLYDIISKDANLRSSIISIGIPILLPDGKSLLRGPEIKIPVFRGEDELPITLEAIKDWTHSGWVDLREVNMKLWQSRIRQIEDQLTSIPEDETSSLYHHGRDYWGAEEELHFGRLVAWIFTHEDKGEKVKD
jgi:hypothetical protein